MASKNAVYPLRPGYFLKIGGYDIARFGDDKCACVIVQQMGALHWEVTFVDEWDHKDLVFTTGKIAMLTAEHRLDKAVIDEDGIGAGPLDTLMAMEKERKDKVYSGFRNPGLSYQDNKWYGNNRTANTYKLKELISKGHICITDDGLIEELESLRYEFDHNQRKILISKDRMRKDGVKSPNKADALIMAVSMIEEAMTKQDVQYQPRYHQEGDNLFQIAGVR